MFRYVIGLLALTFGVSTLADESLTIIDSPVRVVARYEDSGFTGKDCGLFKVTLSVGGGSNSASAESTLFRCGDDKAPLQAQLRKLVSWTPPYLALRTSCGRSNGWNCDTRLILSYRNGTLTRLGHVNDFLHLSKQTRFRKYYTVIEYNDLVAHTGVRVPLVLRDAGPAFAFDAGMTWELNQPQYRRFDRRDLNCDPKKPECNHDFKVAAVFNSTIAKLTGHQAEFQSILAKAKKQLSGEEFNQLTDLLAQVDEQGVIKYMAAETY